MEMFLLGRVEARLAKSLYQRENITSGTIQIEK
jgi:hypothetical protein